MCRAIGEGGRRCVCAGTALVKHNERRRVNRAIRRNVVEWARQNGHGADELEQLAAASPKVAKEWIRNKGLNPNDFVDGVPAGGPGPGPANPARPAPPIAVPGGAVGQVRGGARGGPAGGAGAGGGGGVGRVRGGSAGGGGGGVGAPAAPAGRPNSNGPRWSTTEWCTDELQGQIQTVMVQQGGHRDERSLLSGTPETISTLGNRKSAVTPRGGTNTTRRVELDNGVVGYFKPFGGENKRLEKGFGQDSAQQSLHEAAAWRLASQMGPPWSDIVPPVVIREVNGEVGSFALQRPGKENDRDPWRAGEWREAAFFDCLIGQQDRHGGNYLVAGDRLSLIDHGYTFALPGNVQNASVLVWKRLSKDPSLTYSERDALQRLVSSPDLMGMEKVLQPARAQALRARAEKMLSEGVLSDGY